MDRFQLTFIGLGILLLGVVANYNYWLSRQSLKEQRVVSGIVSSLSRNQTRSRNNATHYELEIRLRANPKIFLIPVRYESAIPAIMEHVQLGDSITAYYPNYAFPSAREPVVLIHVTHQD